MPPPVVPLAAFVGFALAIVAVAVLNGGSPVDFGGLFPAQGRSDWPHGVQEGDAPHFVVDHVDGLRSPGPASGQSQELPGTEPLISAGPRIEPIVANVHRFALKH